MTKSRSRSTLFPFRPLQPSARVQGSIVPDSAFPCCQRNSTPGVETISKDGLPIFHSRQHVRGFYDLEQFLSPYRKTRFWGKSIFIKHALRGPSARVRFACSLVLISAFGLFSTVGAVLSLRTNH